MKTKLSKQEILERVGTMAQLAGIRPYVLREGRKNGVSAADLWNGSGLSMTVLSDRASDIYSVTYQGRSLCWLSGVGASGPWFAHNGPFEWDKNFGGGMLATCGLTTAGLPSADAGETLNLHGDIANLPAEEVNCRTFWEGDDYWLEYSSRTYQAKPYAENLCLTRQIRMRMGDNTIYLHDRVENLGFSATPLMLIYHMNFGYPLLDEGAKLYLTYQDRFPTSDLASQTVDQIGRVTPPDNGYRARAYNHTVRADAEGYAYALHLSECGGCPPDGHQRQPGHRFHLHHQRCPGLHFRQPGGHVLSDRGYHHGRFHRYEDLCLGHPGRRRRSARRHGGRPGGRRHRDLFRGLYQLRLPRCHFVCRADPSASHQAQRTVWQQTDQ